MPTDDGPCLPVPRAGAAVPFTAPVCAPLPRKLPPCARKSLFYKGPVRTVDPVVAGSNPVALANVSDYRPVAHPAGRFLFGGGPAPQKLVQSK